MRELGPRVGLGAPALSGLLDRMSRDGLIERHPDPADGRAWYITLTEIGIRQRSDAVRSARMLNDLLSDGFDDDELAVVERWLEAACRKFVGEN